MIRVLFIIPTLDASGAEKQLTLLATGLPRDRFEPHVVVLTRGGPYEAVLRQAGVPVTVLGKRFKADPVTWLGVRRLIRQLRPDVIQTWLFTANAYGRLAAGGPTGPKIVISERCVDTWKSRWQLWLDRKLLSRTAAVVANSESVSAFYREAGVPAESIRVIPNAVELPIISPGERAAIRAQLGLPADAKVVACINRLAKQKRVDVLIWATQLLRQLTDGICHVIVGDGPERRYLEDLARHFTCDHVTQFLGHRPDAAQLLAAFDVVWLASEFEGQSNTLLEAMAAGLPVIATDIPPNRELIRDGESGLLVRLGDSAAFAQYADRLLADRDFAARLGTAARNTVAAKHSVTAMVGGYAAMYEALTANAAATTASRQAIS